MTLTPTTGLRRTPAASSASGRPAKRSPSSPTTGCTRCSTAARRRPASRSATARSRRLQGPGPGRPGLRRAHLGALQRPPRDRPHPLLHHRLVHLGERPADVPLAPTPAALALGHNGNLTNTAELARGRRAGPARRACAATTDTDAADTALLRAARPDPDLSLEAAALEVLPHAARRVLAGLHGRAHPLRRPRPAGRPPAGARPARARLGGRQRDRRAGHRRRVVRPRGRAGRADRDRRARRCARRASPRPTPRAACSSTSTWPGPTPRSPAAACTTTRVEVGRRLAREHPVDADLVIPVPSRARRRRSATPRPAGSRTASAWSRTPTSAGRSSSRRQTHPPARHPAEAQPAARRRSRASGWSSSTTRSCAATPSGRWCGCCARPAPRRCTCGSPRPPVKWPCFYGIDFATRAELIANGLSVEQIRASHRRRLARLHLAGRADRARPTSPADRLCRACFNGELPDRAAEPSCWASTARGHARCRPADGRRVRSRRGRRRRSRRVPAMTPPAVSQRRPGRRPTPSRRRHRGRRPAVELMKAAVARAHRPEVVGGLGGFAGLFDASALTDVPAAAAGHLAPTGSAPRSRSPRRWTGTTRSGIDLVGMVVDDLVVCGAEPLFMTDYIACGRVVPERIADIVAGIAAGCAPGRLRADRRRDRRAPRAAGRRTTTTSPAPRPAWSRPTGARAATGCGGRRRRRAGLARAALQRLLAGPPRPATGPGWSLDAEHVAELGRTARRGAAQADPDLRPRLPGPGSRPGSTCTRSPTSPAAAWRPTWPACCRPGCDARARPRDLDAAAGLRAGRGARRGADQAEMERTFNLGVGMVARRRPPTAADPALALLGERGLPAWVLGEIVEGSGQARFR